MCIFSSIRTVRDGVILLRSSSSTPGEKVKDYIIINSTNLKPHSVTRFLGTNLLVCHILNYTDSSLQYCTLLKLCCDASRFERGKRLKFIPKMHT